MSKAGESGFRNLGNDTWQLRDGRVMTGDEIHNALLEQFLQEDLQPERAIRWAENNKMELTMLYRGVVGASRRGSLLKDPDTVDGAKEAIKQAHGEVLSETYSFCIMDVEPMSAVTISALCREFDATEDYYYEAHKKGKTAAQAFVNAPILQTPHHLEGVTTRNFVQALIVGSIVKWMPIRAYHESKRFFVNPASKDWHILRMLDQTPEGQDWVDIAFAKSEHDAQEVLPNCEVLRFLKNFQSEN